jgi:hypothetical protein
MASRNRCTLFAEDRGHEELLRAVIERLATENGLDLEVRVGSARGGHGHALRELKLFQSVLLGSLSGIPLPDLIVIGIDSNCQSLAAMRQSIQNILDQRLRDRTVIACPEPHVERWYLADPVAFSEAVGPAPTLGKTKCVKDRYKAILARAVSDAGHISPQGGLEFAREIVARMDWYRAGKSAGSLKMFLDDLRASLKRL